MRDPIYQSTGLFEQMQNRSEPTQNNEPHRNTCNYAVNSYACFLCHRVGMHVVKPAISINETLSLGLMFEFPEPAFENRKLCVD
jgi:hypothetical protein